jgi:hypothetical protein
MTTSGGEIYAAFIEAELNAENDRRESLHARAAAAATRSAGLSHRSQGVGSVPFQQRLGSAPEKEVLGVVKPAGSDNRKSGVDLGPAILASACLTAASMRSLRSRHCRSPTPPPREYPSWRT